MSNNGTPFKTPRPYTVFATPKTTVPTNSDKSDSEESVSSSTSEASEGFGSSGSGLTLLAQFDDLMRAYEQRRDNKVENAFFHYMELNKKMYDFMLNKLRENQKLQDLVDVQTKEKNDLRDQLRTAQRCLDEQVKKNKRINREKEELIEQFEQIKNLLLQDNRTGIPDGTREKLASLSRYRKSYDGNGAKDLSAIQEGNWTGSILSDFSISKTEDELSTSEMRYKRKTEPEANSRSVKRKKSSTKVVEIDNTDKVRATTTVTVSKQGPITATSIIESIPRVDNGIEDGDSSSDQDNNNFEDGIRPLPRTPSTLNGCKPRTRSTSSARSPLVRAHNLRQRPLVMPHACECCGVRIGFSRRAFKCTECGAVCHIECQARLPPTCVPTQRQGTPRGGNVGEGTVGDYTPDTPPMVPALLIHCVNEIETRGLKELGLYRIPGSEKDVKTLKARLLQGKRIPCLSNIDIHVICGCVKDFLRGLSEPLVPKALWSNFTNALNTNDVVTELQNSVNRLPRPNRDTLAYIVMHLQRLADAVECKMPIENLAKVFGPTIVGFSSDDVNSDMLLKETRMQISVMEHLLWMPADYWTEILSAADSQTGSVNAEKNTRTPMIKKMRKQKYFSTPEAFK